MKEIVVIGGTGAQGTPVVEAISASKEFSARVLTRNAKSPRALKLAELPNVTLIEGRQDSQDDLHRAFRGAYGAWVNTDGFTLGEKAELFYGCRAYEIARHERVQHYVYSSADFALKDAGWNAEYHWGHNDAKGRVASYILAQGQEGIKSSVITTGPYMNMLFEAMFLPEEQEDGSFVWANPAKSGKIPLIALEDMGHYSMWLFQNLSESAGIELRVCTDEVALTDIAATFTRVTGKKGLHKYITEEEYFPLAEPFPGALGNWAAGPDAPVDEASMTWRQNFSAWWKFWGQGKAVKRDIQLLNRIHPNRIKSLEEWMRSVQYDGQRRSVLKGISDLTEQAELAQHYTQ
ncbi:NmrA family protein [Boeremia exigua]|uniref:NmrA family protein n=1 Tax=Boeremia exigua TaxID=749465 RepID=UPI001E8DB9A0|nr:NmrA family protein [Boeremia exigua]KAH6638716.1 NmrA family protein [Boeremia exigua]